MANISVEDHTHIERFLPNYDFSARYEIRIDAQPRAVYRCLVRSNSSDVWLVRLLMTIRTGKRMRPDVKPGTYVRGSSAPGSSGWRISWTANWSLVLLADFGVPKRAAELGKTQGASS